MAQIITYRTAAMFTGFSGIVHLVAPLVSGLTTDATLLLVAGIVYLLAAFGLSRRLRWLALLVFPVLLFATLFDFAWSFNGTTVPAWIYAAIAASNTLALIVLFILLWRPKTISA